MERSDADPMLNYLLSVHPLRGGYCYNNFAYEIADMIIEKLSDRSIDSFLKEWIAKPLGLIHSYLTLAREPILGRPRPRLT